MAHEVESMMYVGATPWHGLGIKLDAPPTTKEAIVAAGLDWTVRTAGLMLENGKDVAARAIVRDSDGAILAPAVGMRWTPLQNADAFSFFDPFLANGEATLETAGSLRGGAIVWILAKVAQFEVTPGDTVGAYILLSNAHDGTKSVCASRNATRVVCANTLAMSDREATKRHRARHTASVADATRAIADVMGGNVASFGKAAEKYRALARVQMTAPQIRAFVNEVYEVPEIDEVFPGIMARTPTRADKIAERRVDAIMRLVETGRGADLPGVRGTAWGAYNALTEYLAHDGRGSEATRVEALTMGTGGLAEISERALTLALKGAA